MWTKARTDLVRFFDPVEFDHEDEQHQALREEAEHVAPPDSCEMGADSVHQTVCVVLCGIGPPPCIRGYARGYGTPTTC